MINKTFRLFISSTFNDFLEERAILNDQIFPEIDEFCQNRGYNFQLIDLRWGINTESALNQNTLEICLDEVKRCRTLSPKPNFLIMVGERYGWIPLPSHITKNHFESLLSVSPERNRKLLSEWYLYDGNEIGGEYYLKARTDNFIDDSIWSRKESEIHTALLESAKKCEFSPKEIVKLTASATEREILEGLLDKSNVCNNAIALFRTDYAEKDEDQSRIQNLKQRIFDKMEKDGCLKNIIELKWNEVYSELFKKTIIDMLKGHIEEEIFRLEHEKSNESTENLSAVLENDDIVFYAREGELQRLREYVGGKSETPLFITGESGSGKTSLITEYIKRFNGTVLFGIFRLNEESYTIFEILRKICKNIKTKYDLSKSLDMNQQNISEVLFDALYSVPKDEKLLIVIDGIDMFYDIETIIETVFPTKLPENVKIIISGASEEIINRFTNQSSEFMKIDKFTFEESKDLFSLLLGKKYRQISDDAQKQAVYQKIKNGATPLQIKLLVELCKDWHTGDLAEKIPESAESIALNHITGMFQKYGHNKEFVL